ncbi:MAG TPA: hypothetical protein VJV78_06880 [Polyangiales bacterium]|nr:hypothetical protein [Polyangiales bacterium]
MTQTRPSTETANRGLSPLASLSSEISLRGGSQVRSRVLGQEERNVMLALGVVRAAKLGLLQLEPKLLRAYELLISLDTSREASARAELEKLRDELGRALAAAEYEGYALFDGGSAVFDMEDTRRTGEPLSVGLPDLADALHGEQGLAEFLTRRRSRPESERMAERLRLCLQDARHALREADQQLSELLTHFHRQRSEHGPEVDQADLAQTAALLGQRVLRAGTQALVAQGELSTRASSLVLSSDDS